MESLSPPEGREPNQHEHQVEPERFDSLVQRLGESAETTQAVHALNHRRCKAYVHEAGRDIDAAIVQLDDGPTEPQGYGGNAQSLSSLLRIVNGWKSVLVGQSVAEELGRALESQGLSVRYYDDLEYELTKPVAEIKDPAVRYLTPADEELLSSAAKAVQGAGFSSTAALLKDGVVAAAIVQDHVAGIAYTFSRSGVYADIGVHVLPDFRRKNYGSVAASMVARRLQETGEIPVWSTGADNAASQRIAEKLGFEEIGRRAYVTKAWGERQKTSSKECKA